MRVTLVSPFDPWSPTSGANADGAHVGGVERVYGELARQLARRGHDVTLVCSSEAPSGTIDRHGVRVLRRHRRLTLMRVPLCALARHLPPSDLVQVAATYPLTTAAVLRRARRRGVPAILDFHFEPAPGGLLGRAAAALHRRTASRAYRLADAVTVRSAAYARSAPSLRGIRPSRLRVIPNGFDPRRFHPDGPRRDGDYLLFVGRLVPYKGLDILLQALARDCPRLPLLVAGDGPLLAHLQDRAARLRVDARFLGRVPDDRLPELYRGARLTLLPSINGQEAFGITLLESLACGTPVVASDLPGVADVARLGGLVAPPGDPAALARRIRLALEPGRLGRGRELSRRLDGTYTWAAVTDRFEAVYEEITGIRPPGVAAPLPEAVAA